MSDRHIVATIETSSGPGLGVRVQAPNDFPDKKIQEISYFFSEKIIPDLGQIISAFSDFLLPMDIGFSENNCLPEFVNSSLNDSAINKLLIERIEASTTSEPLNAWQARFITTFAERHLKQDMSSDPWVFLLFMLMAIKTDEPKKTKENHYAHRIQDSILPNFVYLCDNEKEAAALYNDELTSRGYESDFEKKLMVGASLFSHHIKQEMPDNEERELCLNLLYSMVSVCLKLNYRAKEGDKELLANFFSRISEDYLHYHTGIPLSILGFVYNQSDLDFDEKNSKLSSSLREAGAWSEHKKSNILPYFDLTRLFSISEMKSCLS